MAVISTDTRLRPKAPVSDTNCEIGSVPIQAVAIRFQGKPVKIQPRTHSVKAQAAAQRQDAGQARRRDLARDQCRQADEDRQHRAQAQHGEGDHPAELLRIDQQRIGDPVDPRGVMRPAEPEAGAEGPPTRVGARSASGPGR